jgi:WD40 repeat protein
MKSTANYLIVVLVMHNSTSGLCDDRLEIPSREISGMTAFTRVAPSTRGDMLAAVREDENDDNNEIELFDLVNAKTLRVFRSGKKSVTQIAFSPNDKTLLTASHDHTILCTEVQKPHLTQVLLSRRSIDPPCFALNLASKEWLVMHCPAEPEVYGLSEVSGKHRVIFRRAENDVIHVCAISPDGKYIAIGLETGVAIYQSYSGDLVRNVRGKEDGVVTRLVFLGDSKHVIFEQGGSVEVRNIVDGALYYDVGYPFGGESGAITSIRVSSDGATIAIATTGVLHKGRGRLLLLDPAHRRTLGWIDASHDSILDCVFVPGSRKCITCGDGKSGIIEWDLTKCWPVIEKKMR